MRPLSSSTTPGGLPSPPRNRTGRRGRIGRIAAATAGLAVLGVCAVPFGPTVDPATARPASPAARSSILPPPPTGTGITPQPCPAAKGVKKALTADKLDAAYQLTDLQRAGRSGRGVTVAVVEPGPYSQGDLNAFADCYGIPRPKVTTKTAGRAPADKTDPTHTDLVIETILSVAPEAQVRLYRTLKNTFAGYNAALAKAVDDKVPIISISAAWCESYLASTNDWWDEVLDESLLDKAAQQNESVLASSGNTGSICLPPQGAVGLGVSAPASYPAVTGVGGTSLVVSRGSRRSEEVWNSSGGASSGGVSRGSPMPDWQRQLGTISDSSAAPCHLSPVPGAKICREVPDVSADADPSTGYTLYANGSWQATGGTSAATPLWAGLVALMDQGCAGAPAGFLNPKLYGAAAATGYPGRQGSAFHDITTGDNDTGFTGKYHAQVGYDLATGLGTPDAWRLTPYLSCKPQVSSVSPAAGPTTGGTRVTITGTGFDWDPSAIGVRFGSAGAASDVEVLSPTQIQVTSPPSQSPQQIDVTVSTPAGSSEIDAGDHFFYEPDPGETIAPGDPGFSDWTSGGFLLASTSWEAHQFSPDGSVVAPLPKGCFFRAGLILAPMAIFNLEQAAFEHLYGGADWSLARLTPGWNYRVAAYLPGPGCFEKYPWSSPRYPDASAFTVDDRTGRHPSGVSEDGTHSGWVPLGSFEADAHGRIVVSLSADVRPALIGIAGPGPVAYALPEIVYASAVSATPLPPGPPDFQPTSGGPAASFPRTTERFATVTARHSAPATTPGPATSVGALLEAEKLAVRNRLRTPPPSFVVTAHLPTPAVARVECAGSGRGPIYPADTVRVTGTDLGAAGVGGLTLLDATGHRFTTRDLHPTSWSRSSVDFDLPAAVSPGRATLVVTDANRSSPPTRFTVEDPPRGGPVHRGRGPF